MFEAPACAFGPSLARLYLPWATGPQGGGLEMARQGKTLPARQARPALDDSMLIRSAESLGRMIGSLQRQLDGASRKLSATGRLATPGADGNADSASKPA